MLLCDNNNKKSNSRSTSAITLLAGEDGKLAHVRGGITGSWAIKAPGSVVLIYSSSPSLFVRNGSFVSGRSGAVGSCYSRKAVANEAFRRLDVSARQKKTCVSARINDVQEKNDRHGDLVLLHSAFQTLAAYPFEVRSPPFLHSCHYTRFTFALAF